MANEFTQIKDCLGLEYMMSGVHYGADETAATGAYCHSISPADGFSIAKVAHGGPAHIKESVQIAREAFLHWRMVPMPERGLIVREMRDAFAAKKKALGALIALEVGKSLSEGEGEVQEVIDMADYAVGLSRQIGGKVLPSELPSHTLTEYYHPLGPVGVITAFNFPFAVWGWNAMLAFVCGDTVIWKPSPHAPLAAIVAQKIVAEVLEGHRFGGVSSLVVGGADAARALAENPHVPLVSATGSCEMGQEIGKIVAGRLGKIILELGGNNAVTVMDDADLDQAVHSTIFGSVGTSGQRCTTTRRIFVQEGVEEEFIRRMVEGYKKLTIGDPLDPKTHVGPLISEEAVERASAAVEQIRVQGGKILCGGKRVDRPGFFFEPTLVYGKHPSCVPLSDRETFAPITYIFPFKTLNEAIRRNNSVVYGLSSSIFTKSLDSMMQFTGPAGSDCGFVNVNNGTSGAEIGAPFGGNKATGWGREAGGDAWKAYVRRSTSRVAPSGTVALAQGVEFDV